MWLMGILAVAPVALLLVHTMAPRDSFWDHFPILLLLLLRLYDPGRRKGLKCAQSTKEEIWCLSPEDLDWLSVADNITWGLLTITLAHRLICN